MNPPCPARGVSFFYAGSRTASFLRLLSTVLEMLMCFCFWPSLALAHGGGPGLGYDPCMQAAGVNNFVHFAAYQPQFNPFAEYCGALPRTGRTLLVFDLLGVGLPDLPISIKLVQENGAVRLFVPARPYQSGIIDLFVDLPPGRYTAYVSVGEAGLHRLAFPLSVGVWWHALGVPLTIALLILILSASYCRYQMRLLAIERRRSNANAGYISDSRYRVVEQFRR